MEILMDALTKRLGIKLQEWKPEISDSAQQTLRERVRQYISEIIDLADRDILDLLIIGRNSIERVMTPN
jgi:hypothetical protein